MVALPKRQTLRRRRRRVTIVAGFKCQGGAVLCADTQETAQDIKLWVDKLKVYDKAWCQAGFAGSGPSYIVDRLIERITQELDKGYDELARVSACIRLALREVYENEVNPHPEPPEDKIVRLLIAVRPRAQQGITLLKTDATIIHELPCYDIVGVGELVGYIAKSLYSPTLTLAQGVILSTHLVSIAKKYVDSVGGDTHILVITSDGRIGAERIEDSERKERFFDQFNEALKEITLLLPDTSVPTDEVFQRVEVAFRQLKELRERYFDEAIQSDLIQAMTDPDGYQGHTYEHFRLGTMFRIGSEAMQVYEEGNRKNHERARREHESKTGKSK